MVLTWSMTIAAFVIIFVELGTWSSQTIHASVGLATTILCFIQPFMAAMRPHPGAPRRALFNWAHWFVGNVAKICACKYPTKQIDEISIESIDAVNLQTDHAVDPSTSIPVLGDLIPVKILVTINTYRETTRDCFMH